MDVSETYRSHIGTYQSCQDTPIRQLKYWMRIAPALVSRIRYGIHCYFVESGQHWFTPILRFNWLYYMQIIN
jgi:hypothetical protein